MLQKPDYIMRPKKNNFIIKPNVNFKNRLNGEVVNGDLINEEEIEGKLFYVVRNRRGTVIKLTREAFTLQK